MLDIFNEINIEEIKTNLASFEKKEEKIVQSMQFGILYIESKADDSDIKIINLTQDLLPFKDSESKEIKQQIFPKQLFIDRLKNINEDYFKLYIDYLNDLNLNLNGNNYLKIESFIDSKRNIANAGAFLNGVNGYGSLNLHFGYVSNKDSNKELTLKDKLQKISKQVFYFFDKLDLDSFDKEVRVQKGSKNISFEIENNELLKQAINKDYEIIIDSKFNEETLYFEDMPYLIILNIDGLYTQLNLEKSKQFINSFWFQKNNQDTRNGSCKCCLKNKEVILLEEFILPVKGKETLIFNLSKNYKDELDQSGFICMECIDKMTEISDLLTDFNFLFINRNDNSVIPLKSVSDLLSTNVAENLKLGGSLYKVLRGEDSFLDTKNKSSFVKFIYQMEFNFLIKPAESKERYLLVNKLLTLFKLSDNQGRDSFIDKNFKPFDCKIEEDLLIMQIIKNNFMEFMDFISGKKDSLSSLLIIKIIRDIYFHKKDNNGKLILDKTPIFSLFNNYREDFNLDKFKNGGEIKMETIVNSITEKNKVDNNDFSDKEIIVLAGAAITYLMSKSKENLEENSSKFGQGNIDYGFIKDIQISKNSLKRFLMNCFAKYSHAININQFTFRNKFSLIIEKIENVEFRNKSEIQELLYIGLLNVNLSKMFVKYEKEEGK